MIARTLSVLAAVVMIGALVSMPASTAAAADRRGSWTHHAPRSAHRPVIVAQPRYVPQVRMYRPSVSYSYVYRPACPSYTTTTYQYVYPQRYYGYVYQPYYGTTYYYYPSSSLHLQYSGSKWSVGFGYNW